MRIAEEESEMAAREILLEPKHEEILSQLVEVYRNVPEEKRQKFIAIGATKDDLRHTIFHEGLPGGQGKFFLGDLETLERAGLLARSYEYGTLAFDITPPCFQYYRELKRRISEPVKRIERETRTYLDADRFRATYPAAYQRWTAAEALLWDAEAKNQLTTIGHVCREAMQEFVSALVERYQIPNVETDKAKTINRMKTVLESKASQFGETERIFLDALLMYWKAIDKLIQRQEHGGQREGEPLVWEDGRRSVFQTAGVMFEIDKALLRAR